MSNHPPIRNNDPDLDVQFERLAAAQRNITPQDQLVNGRSVDDAFWNGFEKPRGIQKAGLLVYSGTLLLIAVAFAGMAYDSRGNGGTVILWLFTLALTAIAVKIASNAFRTRKKPRL